MATAAPTPPPRDLLSRLASKISDFTLDIVTTLTDAAGRSALMAASGHVAPAGDPPNTPDVATTLAELRDRFDSPDPNTFELLRDLSTVMIDVVAFIQQAAGARSADDAWNFFANWFDLIALDRLRRDELDVVVALRALHVLSDNRILIGDLVRARSNWGTFLLGNPPDDDAKADNWSIILGAVIAVLGKYVPAEEPSGTAWRTDMLFGWDANPHTTMPRAERALQRMASLRLTHRDKLDSPASPATATETAGISVLVVPPDQGGWGLWFSVDVGAGLKVPLGESLALSFETNSPSAVQAFFGAKPFVRSGVGDASLKVTLSRKSELAEHWTIGADNGVHFEVGQFSTGFEFKDPTTFKFSLADAALVIPPSSMGFIGSVLPSGGVKFNVDVALTIDTHGKLSFQGGAGFTVTVPVNASLLVLKVRSITIALAIESGPKGTAATLSAVAAFGLAFGKSFNVDVDGMGAKLLWTLPSSPNPPDSNAPVVHGNLGPAGDIALDFVPPKGIGVLIDVANVIKGGGFFWYDPAHRTYAGMIEASLSLCGTGLQIKAAGLLRETDTGWDFVLILSAEFKPAIEIFLGMSLNGVGGMLGINVAVDVDKLRAGLRDGAMGRLLFPNDPVANAPAIIATMAAIFPHRQGGVIAGPMLQIGWGRPTSFVTLSVAVIVATPSPALLIIMGRLTIAAPHARLAIVDVKADFLGIIDFQQPLVSFDATLVDSRLSMFPITGDMAMRAGKGGFILSIGGFNPRFTPPADLANMRRIAIDITPNPLTKIRCDAYVAITSNTFQIGLHIRLDIDAHVASIHGWLDFDAMLRREPRLSFSVELKAGLELRVGGRCLAGVSVALLLEGPGLWHAKGDASIHIFFFSFSVGFEVTWGELETSESVQQIDASAQVVQALSAPGAWSSVAPSGNTVATFRAAGGDVVGVDPDGMLTVRQQVVPLGIAISRVGLSHVVGGTATVTLAPIGGAPPATPTKGQFAAGEFMDLSDDEKLSRPSFEMYDDGMSFGSTASVMSAVQVTPGSYETVFIPERRPRVRAVMDATLLSHGLGFNAVSRSGLHFATLHDGPDQRVSIAEPGWRVVAADTLGAVAAAPAAFESAASAFAAARATASALGADRVLVVDTCELVT